MGAVLVTGGAGYVGSHAVKGLRQAGYDVVVLDDLSAGHREATRGAPLIEADVRDTRAVRETLRRHAVTAVLHFAALLSVGESVREPVRYYRTNVEGALSILDAMVSESVRHFVFSSTAAVYGEPVDMPIREDHPTRPVNAYGESKLAIERALPHFERAYGLRAMTLRYFNASGADPDGELGEDHAPELHLIPLALRAAAGGPPLAIFGDDYPTPDGTCLRDFVHVTDLAEAHVLALRMLEAGAVPGAYNLGTGRPHSVREVVSAVERVTGCEVPVRTAPRRAGDPGVLFASSDRARAQLGWRPRYEHLDTIVATAWRWHQAHPAGFGESDDRLGARG